jgi:hypothetical protein
MTAPDTAQLAERLRTVLIQRATAALEDARLRGLCWEGAWEAAVAAMQSADLATIEQGSPSAAQVRNPGRI